MNTRLMDNALVTPELGLFTLTGKNKGEVSVSARAIKTLGGIDNMTRRIVALWLAMPEHYRKAGLGWFNEANHYAGFLSETYEISLWQSSQVISILSPQNPWEGKYSVNGKRMGDGNKLCVAKLLDAWFRGGRDAVMALEGWGYAPDFMEKCLRVLAGEELDWSGAPKTHRFALIIFDPTRSDIVVADSHASRVATGNLGGRYHVVGAGAYPLIEEAYLRAGVIVGEQASTVQAGCWVYVTELGYDF